VGRKLRVEPPKGRQINPASIQVLVFADATILALEGARSYSAARFEHGLLVIELRREVPEALKPRRIEIATASGQASVAQNNVTTLDQSKVA